MSEMARKKQKILKPQVENNDEQIQLSSLSITDLPAAIIVEIVLKLPMKSIVMCKSVCKSWRYLISDPQFAECHLAQAKTCTFFRNMYYSKLWRSLYLLEPEEVCGPDGYCVCRSDHEKCNNCCSTTLTTRLMFPERKPLVMLDKVINEESLFCIKTRSKSQRLIPFKTGYSYSHMFTVVNSAHGLLCLSNGMIQRTSEVNPVVVCNPVTGEFTRLPNISGDGFVKLGLGFSPKHNQYKVLRTVTAVRTGCLFFKLAEIHTLGTGGWRKLDISGVKMGSIYFPSYLDGALYWIFYHKYKKYQLASFDMDEEQFQVHPDLALPSYSELRDPPHLSLKVLGGRLYLFTKTSFSIFDIWVMDRNGTSKCWTKLFSIDFAKSCGSHTTDHRYELICCVNNEAVVLFCKSRNELVYYDQLQGMRFKHLKFSASNFEAFSHIPSFVSLKSIVNGVEVSKVSSRCEKLKFLEETYPVLLLGGREYTWLIFGIRM